MMTSNKRLLSIEQVTHDDSGVYAVGELDFSISEHLYDYIKSDDGLDKVIAMIRAALNTACRVAGKECGVEIIKMDSYVLPRKVEVLKMGSFLDSRFTTDFH